MIEDSGVHENTTGAVVDEMQLLAAIAKGDKEAMASLFKLHSRLVFSIAMRVLREQSAAEDVVQEVFLQIWRNPVSFSPARGRLKGFIAVVARNKAIDVLRRRPLTDSIDDVVLASEGNLTDTVVESLMIERVRDVLTHLPSEQSGALEMAFFGGLTHSEIASATGIPLGTVKTRVRSALIALRRALDL